MTHAIVRPLLPLVAALILAGCATAPGEPSHAMPSTPSAFKEQQLAPADGRWTVAPPAEGEARGTWWKSFGDPVLDDLVARAERDSTSLQLAAARLAQARSLVRSADADRWPQLGAAAQVTRQGGAMAQAAGTAGTVGTVSATLSYEVDLFGRIAKASDAARLDAAASEALLQSTRLLVQSQVAQSYFALRALDAERRLVRQTVAAYEETEHLVDRRYRAGDIAELDLARVRSEVAATRSQALALDRQRATLEHALAVLVGEVASGFSLAEAPQWDGTLPTIPAGVPAAVLARRPDVSAAQRSLLAAQARLGIAQTAWFPDLALTANGGYASPDLGDLFKWSTRAWGVGALLSLPIFDGGRRDAAVAGAAAQLDEAAAGYREQVLVAFRDVEDELASLRLLNDQADAVGQAVTSASRATALSDSRYRNGLVSQLELLDAQRSELANRRQALQVRAARFQATVGLVRALGGGWQANEGGA
ncbi:efflux transporter outer membrane subunit [Ideonella sp. YS5]|uniref:efflux transporter outer membrane subunit n=1 Tax=Ideonella sp. YS5 TaxID=3453714 RepID=UPI003EEA3E11